MGAQKNTNLILRTRKLSLSVLASYLINISAGVFFAFFAYANIRTLLALPELNFQALVYLAMFSRNSSLILLFIIRRPATESSKKVKEWLVAVFGSFVGCFYSRNGLLPDISSFYHTIVWTAMILAVLLTVLALVSLGRSFGVVPSNRGIQTRGLYSIVRHPVYASYILFDIIFLSIAFSLFNLSIFCVSSSAQYLRTIYEERFLIRDPLYQQYAEKTRYRFFPSII